MATPILKPNSSWFTPTLDTTKQSLITIINIVDSYTPSTTPTDSWDASVAQDGSIMCYVEGTTLTIAGNGSGQIMANEDSSYMFYGMTNLTSVDCGVLNTSNTTNMQYMFGYTSAMKLTSIIFGDNFNTSKVTNFSHMFERCTTIQNIDVSGFDISSAITLEKMFNNCKALTYLNVSKWDTGNVENMMALFQQCNNLEEFSVAHFNTSKVTNMGFMFYRCNKFTKIDVENWDVGNVETFDHFISNSGKITEFDTSKWNVSNKCKNLNAVFHSYQGESIDIRSWDTSNVEVFCQMFDGCKNLTEIKGLESLDTSNGRDFTQMFYANKIKHLDLSSIDTTHAVPNYPLGGNGTTGAGMYQFMYMTWNNLEKITLGEKLSFDGDGSCTLDTPSAGSPHCYFQFPNSSSGSWYTIDGAAYTPAEIQAMENPAGTYYASPTLAIWDRDSKKYVHLAAMREYHDMQSAEIDRGDESTLASAKTYADTVSASAANTVKNELLNGAGDAYDTLLELGTLIDENNEAIDALREIASNKSDKGHTHTMESIDGLQEAVNAAADSKFYVVIFDQGDDGEYHADLTFAEIREKFEAGGNMVARIDGTDYIPLLSAAPHQIIFSGIYQATSVSLTIDSNDVCTLSSTGLARSTHSHPTASSSASGFMSKGDKIKLDDIETGAEVNVIESITVNGEEVTVTDKAVNIEIPEQIKSDWNQNDEAAVDYIKNKPFYYNTEVLLDTITVNNDDTLDFSVLSFGNTGDVVIVIWDGVPANKTIGYCEAKLGRFGIPYNTIGNQNYVADEFWDGGEDTGEDYVIYSGEDAEDSAHIIICDDQSHTLSIVKGTLVQIDEKFIPETIAKKSYVDEKVDEVIANIPSVTDVETKMPITLGAFYYYKWGELPGSTVEEKANNLAKYDVIVYQDSLCNDLEMNDPTYERDLALYKKALEYNPDLKVFGYVTARGFANSKSGGHVGMTEYRTSPENVDHPIWTKEELAAYINLMAHCGGTKDDSTTDEFGNPVLTGGVPLYGVFFDDWDYHFNDDNTHIMNQGDWPSIREKHNFLIDYCHSCGLQVMANSNPTLIFDNTETPNSIRNPDGIPSNMTADDWFCVESYFLRSDKTFSTTDSYVTTYNENYREAYKSKCLALAYVNRVDDDSEDNEQIANTFALYQALCQGADSIALHGSNCITEIPEEFAKYYDKNNNAIYTSGTGYYKLTVNGHTVTATRNASATSYGQSPNAAAFATCKIIIDDHNVFNNMCVRNEEMLYKFADVNKDIKELNAIVEQSSNLYHRALIDDWKKDFTLADYTNYSFTFQNAFGGEDTGATSSWNSSDPYSAVIYLPKQYSWRRVETNISHLAGKTVELGFENIDVYLSGSPTTKISGIAWEVIAVCDSGTVTITKFNTSTMQKSVIDGVSRCCAKFTFPEDVQTLRFWTQRQSATPEGTWIIDFDNSYLVDINEHPIQKTWYTNYAPASGSWGALGSNSKITYGDDAITVDYTATTQCYEARMQFPANTAIFKPGETWELGFKDIKLTHLGTGADITSKLIILFNLGSQLVTLSISGKSHDAFLNMKSEVSDDRIAIARFTVPADYAGGMVQTPMYVYTNGYVGGDSNGFYQLYIEGLYLYKLDERDELFIRGEDLSDTYIGINRVRTDTIDEKLKPDFLYVVDDGSMFITDFRGDRVDIRGKDGKDGKDGTDGVSATHSWSGTTLTITSASGTSSANLKGDKGDTGSTGTSVTVSNVSESTASGGTNVVTFSDGKKVNIKNGTNGAKGADGKTPVRGTDYWTEEDKAEIVRQVLASMAMPVAGIVDENNNIIITGELPDGAYTLRYEFADGSSTSIGTLSISSGPAYTNLADPTSTEWLTNKRINSSKNVVDVTEAQRGDKTVVVTNHIDITGVSKLHIKGLDIINNLVNGSSTQNFGRMYAYKDGAVYLSTYQVSSGVSGKTHYTYADYDSSVVILDVAAAFADWGYTNITEISLGGILTGAAEDVIITADENIV